MATNDSPKDDHGSRAREEAEVAARRSFLKAGTTAGVTGVTVMTLGRKAWAAGSAGASGGLGGSSK